MKILSAIKRYFVRARDDERGSMVVEITMMMPILAWALVGPISWFDGFRKQLISIKATYTIADVYSRETTFIDSTFLNGTRSLLWELLGTPQQPNMRVTVYRWSASDDEYRTVWSRNRGVGQGLNNERLNAFADVLPNMVDNQRGIFVETWTDYTAKYSLGIESQVFYHHAVISPRFAPTLCWNDNEDPFDEDASICGPL